jgi:hypothetical protein
MPVLKVISAASTNATLVRAGETPVNGYSWTNQHATDWAWLKFYNKATAPTVGTDVPVVTVGLPPESAGHIDWRDRKNDGLALGVLGLGIGLTADEADGDSASVGAGAVVVNLFYG